MFAFNTHTLTRLAHVQGMHAVRTAARPARRRPRRHAHVDAGRGLAGAVDDGDGLHVGLSGRVRAAMMVAVVVARRACATGCRRPARCSATFALAAALAAVASLPIYAAVCARRTRAGHGALARNGGRLLGVAEGLSRRRRDASTSRPGAAGFFKDPVDAFFPGFVVIALAGLAVWQVWRRARRPSPPHRR